MARLLLRHPLVLPYGSITHTAPCMLHMVRFCLYVIVVACYTRKAHHCSGVAADNA